MRVGMDKHTFPIYRKLANERSFYRIDSATAFVEVQRLGSRWVLHRVEARIYPEKARIHELLVMADPGVLASDAPEFDRWLALVERS